MSRIEGSLAVVAASMLGLDVTAAALGWWTRPVADSWCTADQVRDQGVLSTVWDMYAHENGRLAAAVANSVSGVHNGALERLFPALTMVIAVGAALSLFAALRRTVVGGYSRVAVLVLAAGVAASSLLLGRSAYQSFLWAPGAITHTWPPLVATFVASGAVRVATRGGLRTWAPIGAASAFVAATFDEVTAVLMVTLAAIALADRSAWRRGAAAWVTYVRACVIGVVAGVVVLLASPGFHSRSGGTHPTATLLAGGFTDIARWLLDFLTQWPLVALVAIALVVGFRSERADAAPPRLPRRLLVAPVAVVLVALVVDVTALRVGYGATGPAITPRAFSEFFVPAVIATGIYGLLGGRALKRRGVVTGRGLTVATGLAATAIVVGTAGLAWQSQQLSDVLSTRAASWDAQNARVEHAAHSGVHVVRYTPLPVAGLADPFWLAGYHDWVAGCVKTYYHVSTLRDGRLVR